jgi:hypothetical protein
MALTAADAQRFFSSLYHDKNLGLEGNMDAAATRLIASQGGAAVTGDQALQALMIHHALSSPQNAAKASAITASLGGIKSRSVDSFIQTFPGVTVDDLIQQARAAGHDVEVL